MQHHHIQYVEFLTEDFDRIRSFYEKVFSWEFTVWSEEYISFENGAIEGGFAAGKPTPGSVRVIIYSDDVEASQKAVELGGGTITKEIFSFPGGRRFEFTDPDGNEMAVWTTV